MVAQSSAPFGPGDWPAGGVRSVQRPTSVSVSVPAREKGEARPPPVQIAMVPATTTPTWLTRLVRIGVTFLFPLLRPYRTRARLALAGGLSLSCQDLAGLGPVPSQVSSVLVTVLMPCIAGIFEGADAGWIRVSTMSAARRGADSSCGSITVTR